MNFSQYLLENYGYNEPILTDELRKELDFKDSTLRMNLKRLVDQGKLERYTNGIYFIPKPNSILKKQAISLNKVIKKKYLYDGEEPIGYKTGIGFANELNLTTQTSGVIELVTNKETNQKRPVNINKWRVILRKPRTPVKKNNVKVLQVLDLITNLEKISEKPIDSSINSILDYLGDTKFDTKNMNVILSKYPKRTILKVHESGVYDALTRR